MKYFKVTYYNGYCGYDENNYFTAEDGEAAYEAAERNIGEWYCFYEPDYRLVDEDDYETEEEYEQAVEDYQNDIYFEIEEITKEEYEND